MSTYEQCVTNITGRCTRWSHGHPERIGIVRSQIERVDTLCAGIVTRAGEQDACCKDATTIVYDIESADVWPACTWHAHRYGGALTLAEIREAIDTGVTWIEREVSYA